MKWTNLFLFFLISLFLIGCAQEAKEPIKIGSILPLTGEGAYWGKHVIIG